MRLIPYLQSDGQGEEAFRLYETSLGGKITFMTRYAEASRSDALQPVGWVTRFTQLIERLFSVECLEK